MAAGELGGGVADAELLRGWAARADVEAFTRLVERHRQRAFRRAYAVLGDAMAAEDCAQEVLLRLAERPEAFGGRGSFSAWLDRVVTNAARAELRRRARRDYHELTAAHRSSEERKAAVDVLSGLPDLTEQIAKLPDVLRRALHLHFVEGCTYREVAAALRCPPGTASSRIRLGIARLRRALSAKAQPPQAQ